MPAPAFTPLPQVPDHPALEREVLAWWERERIFEQLRERNRGGPPWSFVDGPITANKRMGVHHAWGRTLKDVFQRYHALRGFDQRYQNGFDCQGLWVEVGVERELGLDSKQEIEEYGLAAFSRRCRERVADFARQIVEQSKRLGMWMDWGNDYYTFSDTNIEYIWRFLQVVHERGWLYQGHRATEWCPRCGTSISAHELLNAYADKTDPSLYVRFPLREPGHDGESLVVWTTTPWTLPANVAAAVAPDAEYVLVDSPRGREWVARERLEAIPVAGDEVRSARGAELVGFAYEGPFDELRAQEGVVHRVVPWADVTLEEGTGVVHIAPGCGGEDFELAKAHDLPVLAPVNEAGRFYPGYGRFEGRGAAEVADDVVERLRAEGRLVEATTVVHRYPFCWRCDTPLLFRLTDDWFIRADEIREPMLAANATVKWTPDYFGKRMDDWLRNMGDWNISRKRYFGLPLPFYPCACGHLNVIGSLAELRERALAGLDGLEELHRPWIDDVTIACAACGGEVRRIPEVGDVWLDAGIVPFSTLGWRSEARVPGGNGTGAARGLTGADLHDHAYWERWFPATWVSEMREQIRLWFYSLMFMSVALTGEAPYREVLSYEKLLDEAGREMHGSWGNAIDADEAMERMGADVMRWLYCEQPPTQNIRFGYGPAEQVKSDLLRLWNSVSFLVSYGNIEGFRPQLADLEAGPRGVELRPLDRWLVERTRQLLRDATAALDAQLTFELTRAFSAFVDDLSNWYIRRSRRRFYGDDGAAFRTLWYALVQGLRVVAPVMPFLAEHLWRNLVALPCPDAPRSVFLAPWPEPGGPLDEALLAEMREVRAVVTLGHQARSAAGIKVRQPLRRLVVRGADAAAAHAGELRDELNVKELEFGEAPAVEVRVKPNLPLLGPRLGKELGAVRAALQAGEFEWREGGGVRAAGHELSPEEVLVERAAREGWSLAEADGVTVALATALDAELELEAQVRDLIRRVNAMRKDAGLALTDRIVLTLPEASEPLLAHADRIKQETLAVAVESDGGEVRIAKA